MPFVLHHGVPWFLALVAALAVTRCSATSSVRTFAVSSASAVTSPSVHAEEPDRIGSYLWLDVNGQPLPFQDHEAIRDGLRTAEVISRKKTDRGVAGAEKLTLEVNDTRFHAVFRSVDINERAEPAGGIKTRPKYYRDAAIFESAAYELSQLLGINSVPPVVERQIDGQSGTVQIWMEETLPEVERIERGLRPPDGTRWIQQRAIMAAFDALIANTDRNQGNSLFDRYWTLWFIDHTRAFKDSSKIHDLAKLETCERRLWDALRSNGEETIRPRLEPYLECREINALLKRRLKLIKHFEALISKHGEDVVLFDLRPPGAERADWNDQTGDAKTETHPDVPKG